MRRRHFLSSISTIALGSGLGLIPARGALACGDCDNYVRTKRPAETAERRATSPYLGPDVIAGIVFILAVENFRANYMLTMTRYFSLIGFSFFRLEGLLRIENEIISLLTNTGTGKPAEAVARSVRRYTFSDKEIAAFKASLKKAKDDWNSFNRTLRAKQRKARVYNPALRVLTPKAQAIVNRKLAEKNRKVARLMNLIKGYESMIKSLRKDYDHYKKQLDDARRLARKIKRDKNASPELVRNVERAVRSFHGFARDAELKLQRAVDESFMIRRRLASVLRAPAGL